MRPPRMLAVGYLSIDRIETPYGRYGDMPGGAALYAALGIRHAGGQAAILAAVGDDYPEQWLHDLADFGIDVSRVQRLPGPTRRAVLKHTTAGRLSPLHNDRLWWERSLALAPVPQGDERGFDGVVACPMPMDALCAVVDWAGQNHLPTVADTSEAFATRSSARLLVLLNKLVAFAPSREETRLLFPELADDAAAVALAQHGVHVLQKRGADGALAVPAGSCLPSTIAAPLTNAVDPTGAGDATVGALATRLCAGEEFVFAAAHSLQTGAAAVGGIGPSGFGLTVTTSPRALDPLFYEPSHH